MEIPTEPIGSIPRPRQLIDALREHGERVTEDGAFERLNKVQIDLTEARLAVKLDPTGQLLSSFIDLNNIALAGEADRQRVLRIIREHLQPHHQVFVDVISPIDPQVESAEEVRDRVLEAARYIPASQLGTTDDCGFAPFYDDVSTSREISFAKIRARVVGTAMAERALGARR